MEAEAGMVAGWQIAAAPVSTLARRLTKMREPPPCAMVTAARFAVRLPAALAPVALLAGLLGALGGATAPAGAVPRLDLTPYPAPAPGERRWVIQLPGVLPPSREPSLSPDPSDWRVQLIAGRDLELDCNTVRFSGRMRSAVLPGSDLRVVRISQVTPLASTRMACPPDQPKRRAFVVMGDRPFVVPYNVSRPIVIYAPKELALRWRLWKAERRQWPAREL